jgi:hypothetical protein
LPPLDARKKQIRFIVLKASFKMATTYGLVNSYFGRLTARTGKVYRFVYCMVVAQDEQEARHLAVKNDRYGIDWQNREQISCEAMRECGRPAPEGFVGYQAIEAKVH